MRKCLFLSLLIVGFGASAQKIVVPPYLQPGDASTLSKELKVVIWQTDSVQGSYVVEYGEGSSLNGAGKISTAKVSVEPMTFGRRSTFIYRASLTGLSFDAEYTYRVKQGEEVVGTATFMTRTKQPKTRFVAFGDCGAGTPQQAAIAYHVYLQKPQFVMITGDLAYNNGLEREFRSRFFPFYTQPEATPEKGAPLMQSIPFYLAPGNHDVYGYDLGKFPDGLALYYYSDPPSNAPQTQLTTDVTGPADRVKAFKKATDGRFTKINNYSFDVGNVHITVLDANTYVNPLDQTLMDWLRKDVSSSKAEWKIVSFHQPGFSSSKTHYDYQQMRLLAPILEELNVDLVINSHIHNYQRSKPLKFAPKVDESGQRYVISPEGRVDGKFKLDEKFDGVKNTKSNGVIYIVSGSGGAALYDPAISNNPELWKHEPAENWVPYTVKLISDVHSFTLVETDGKTMKLKQIKYDGETLDEITVTK